MKTLWAVIICDDGHADERLAISATCAALLASIFVCFVSEATEIKAHAGSAALDKSLYRRDKGYYLSAVWVCTEL